MIKRVKTTCFLQVVLQEVIVVAAAVKVVVKVAQVILNEKDVYPIFQCKLYPFGDW